jgi:hypothetical protein
MRSPLAFLLATASIAALAGACSRRLTNPDALESQADAYARSDAPGDSSRDAERSDAVSDAVQSDGGQDAAACYPLFHACTSSAECCAPNLCINITGTPACQVEGPAPTRFTSWTSCGWASSEACLCEGIRACQAVAGGSFSALGSKQARICAIDGDVYEFVVFTETEGGGRARRCRVPVGAGFCSGGFAEATDGQCVDLFTCNLLMGTCPADVTPGGSVISCR